MSGMFDNLSRKLANAGGTELGRKALSGHDEDFQLEIEGYAPIHVEINNNDISVRDEPSPRNVALQFTRIQLSEEVLTAILNGDESPIQAMERGALFIRSRLYGGALFIMLLRAAYDLALKQRLEVGKKQ